MAAGWSVILEGEVPGIAPAAGSGKSLLYFQRQIDDLAKRLKLSPLSGFFSRSRADILAYLQDAGVERDPESVPDEQWFDPADGLATVRGLLDSLREDPTSVPDPVKIIADLEQIESALVGAAESGVRFHLGRQLAQPERE
jgi:hypothetical protein